ncbi:MAG TPA: GNAT family N-acetyltransferase [Methanomassiliicoccales archaeon]
MSVEIVRFTQEDLAFGKGLTDSEGWNRNEADWKRLLRLEPDGFFKARLDGLEVGIIGFIRYDRLAWINSLIVRKESRARQIGKELLSHCLEAAERSGATSIKLDSVPGVEPFYERFGFRTEFLSLRFMGNVHNIEPPSIEVFTPGLEEVVKLDIDEVGIDRARILKVLFEEPTAHVYACGERNNITGYIMCRQAQGRVDLGPCVVKDGEPVLVEQLLRATVSNISAETFRLCVPGNNVKVAKLIRALGFEQHEGATRMSRGEPFEEPTSIVSMMSPEKG